MDLEINDTIKIPANELLLTFARSGGPGGQNVNKVNTKVSLSFALLASGALPEDVKQRFMTRYGSRLTNDGRIVIASDESRSREMNTRACYEKLKDFILSVAVKPKVRRATKPSYTTQVKGAESKKRRSAIKKSRGKVES